MSDEIHHALAWRPHVATFLSLRQKVLRTLPLFAGRSRASSLNLLGSDDERQNLYLTLEHSLYAPLSRHDGNCIRGTSLAPYAEPFDKRLIPRLISCLDIVEQLAALGNELEEPTARVIVFEMGLKMLGQICDTLSQNRYLNLWRTGVARLLSIVVDQRLFALGRNRHRMTSLKKKMRDKPRHVEGMPQIAPAKGFLAAAALEKFS
jgi:hypothetical protein